MMNHINNDCRIVFMKDLYNNMSNDDFYYSCKLVEKMFDIKNQNNKKYDSYLLNEYYKKINNINIPVQYYAFDGDYETKYCTCLDYLLQYLEFNGDGLDMWKNIYFDLSGKSEKIISTDKYFGEITLNSLSSNCYNHNQRKSELDKITRTEVDDFIESVSSNDLFSYFDMSTLFIKDSCCGDTISLGIKNLYSFEVI